MKGVVGMLHYFLGPVYKVNENILHLKYGYQTKGGRFSTSRAAVIHGWLATS